MLAGQREKALAGQRKKALVEPRKKALAGQKKTLAGPKKKALAGPKNWVVETTLEIINWQKENFKIYLNKSQQKIWRRVYKFNIFKVKLKLIMTI